MCKNLDFRNTHLITGMPFLATRASSSRLKLGQRALHIIINTTKWHVPCNGQTLRLPQASMTAISNPRTHQQSRSANMWQALLHKVRPPPPARFLIQYFPSMPYSPEAIPETIQLKSRAPAHHMIELEVERDPEELRNEAKPQRTSSRGSSSSSDGTRTNTPLFYSIFAANPSERPRRASNMLDQKGKGPPEGADDLDDDDREYDDLPEYPYRRRENEYRKLRQPTHKELLHAAQQAKSWLITTDAHHGGFSECRLYLPPMWRGGQETEDAGLCKQIELDHSTDPPTCKNTLNKKIDLAFLKSLTPQSDEVPNYAVFSGVISTKLGVNMIQSGYAAMIWRGHADLHYYNAFEIIIRKRDSRRYFFNLTTEDIVNDRALFQASIGVPNDGHFHRVILPFDNFKRTEKGQILALQARPHLRRVYGLGFMMNDRADGPFHLEIESITAIFLDTEPDTD